MFKIIIDSDIPFVRGILEPFAEVSYIKGAEIDKGIVRDADAVIIRTRTKCTREMLEGSAVKIICTATIGYDHIDTEYCKEAGIIVRNAAGCNARGVLQWVAAALCYLAEVYAWKPKGKKIGVIGCGNVGALVAYYAKLWGFDVLCCDPPLRKRGEKDPNSKEFVDYDTIIKECDIISFHVPLVTDGECPTYHMADEAFFRSIKNGVAVLNSSRGEVVDNGAFRNAVADGKCLAAIDTWESEPDIDRALLEKAEIATPHVAGYSLQGKANASAMAVRAVADFFELPLREWYPQGMMSAKPVNISWQELNRTIGEYYNIIAETNMLKRNPLDFEEMRNSYEYRREYF